MAFDEEQTREALRYLNVAINGTGQDNVSDGIKDYPYNAYRSKRPFWIGFFQTLEKEGVSIYPDEVCRDSQVVLTREPISFLLQQQLEISPANLSSKLALCTELFSEKTLVLYNAGMSSAKIMWQIGDKVESFNINNSGIYYTASDLRGFNDAPDWMVYNAIREGFTRNASINHRLSKFVGNDIANAVIFANLLNRIGYSSQNVDFNDLLKSHDAEIKLFLNEQLSRDSEYTDALISSWKTAKFLNVFDRNAFDFPFEVMNQLGDYSFSLISSEKNKS
jgi:hypothetical protein